MKLYRSQAYASAIQSVVANRLNKIIVKIRYYYVIEDVLNESNVQEEKASVTY